MLSDENLAFSLGFFCFFYLLIGFLFRDGVNKKKSLVTGLLAVGIAYAIKLGYEKMQSSPNMYKLLETGKYNTALEIRQSYKRVSRKYHPDKNPSSDAEVMFQKVKSAYDILMDESARVIYNRFGEEAATSGFDPRLDELKLLSSIAVLYVYWAVCVYIMTLPYGARACRTWIAILGIAMLIVEATLSLTESSLPQWMPHQLTEYEFIQLMHGIFPALACALRCVAESLYVDVDKVTMQSLNELILQQKAMSGLLHQLQVMSSSHFNTTYNKEGDELNDSQRLELINTKIAELRNEIEMADETSLSTIELLRNSTSNPGSKYYWIIFVFIYAGVYLFQ